MSKILHFIPAYNRSISVDIAQQMYRDGLIAVGAGHEFEHRWLHSCDLVMLRNKILKDALNGGFDYLYSQDADCFSPAPRGALEPLLELMNKSGATMTGAMVTLRTRPPKANVWPCHPGQAYECDKIGTGIVLIDLNKVREWYDDYDGPCFYRTYHDAQCASPHVGLDVFFCKVIHDNGGTIACDARIPTVHIDATFDHFYNGETAPGMADSIEERTEPDLGRIITRLGENNPGNGAVIG